MISLNYRDSRPIYEQIEDGLRKLIVTGALGADEKLPSVRALAAQLAINPNTIQRAYNELEGEGYIYSVPGKGSFVSANAGADEVRRRGLHVGDAGSLLQLLQTSAVQIISSPQAEVQRLLLCDLQAGAVLQEHQHPALFMPGRLDALNFHR